MAEQDSKNPMAVITAVAAIFGASWWLNTTPTSSRPKLSGSAPQVLSSVQDVAARLWQDPVRIATEHYNQALWSPQKETLTKERPEQRLAELKKWLARRESSLDPPPSTENGAANKKPTPEQLKSLVLIVMLPGGSAPERSELRLRIRQAVIYALGSATYRPLQSDNIGYLRLSLNEPSTPAEPPPVPIAEGTPPTCPWPQDVQEQAIASKRAAMLTVPFEGFVLPLRDPTANDTSPALQESKHSQLNSRCDRVAVLWLCDDLPGPTADQLLLRTATAIDCVDSRGNIRKNYDLKILGPSSSEVLQQLWSEGGKFQDTPDDRLDARGRFLQNITITSPLATVDAAAIKAFRLGLKNRLEVPRVERTVLDDYVVCSELVEELTRRDVVIHGSGSRDQTEAGSRTWRTGHIALLTEWDTFYGRVLPLTFRRALANHPEIFANKRRTDETSVGSDPVQVAGDPIKQYESLLEDRGWPLGLERFVYLKGLDGRPPDDKQQRITTSASPSTATSAERLATEGESQADAVVRLVGQLSDRHDQLIRQGRGGFRAIGVLGSDVYDKLMLLRALRREFRGVVFFTNELDARLALPEETPACRNLVVASAYGLSLKADYQHTIPPFRSSTQTAVFAAMLHLLGGVDLGSSFNPATPADKPRPIDLGTVRLFEIGLRGAVDLTIPKSTQNWPLAGKSGGLLHPERFAVRGPFSGGSTRLDALTKMGIIASILSLVLLVGFYNSQLARVTITRDKRRKTSAERELSEGGGTLIRFEKIIRISGRNWIGFIVPPIAAFAAYLWFLAHATPEGEPFTLFDGTSSWQTFAVMTFAALFCIHLICRTELILHQSDDHLANEYQLIKPSPDAWDGEKYFRPPSGRHPKLAQFLKNIGQKKLAERFTRQNQFDQFLDLILMRWHGTSTALKSGEELISANRLWLRYLFLGRFGFRVLRAFVLTALAFTGIWIAFHFSPPPPLPFRSSGGPPFVVAAAAIGTFLFSTLLLFVVSDAVILSCALIRRLDRGRTVWPSREHRGESPLDEVKEDTAAKRSSEKPVENAFAAKRCQDWRERMLAERGDIGFIEKRTRAVGRITHYPFFMVALIFVARNRYFDDWAMPLGIIITYVMLLGITISLSCWLNHSARSARENSLTRLENLKTEIDNYCFSHPGQRLYIADLLRELQDVREDIKGMRDGSYAPFWDQPAFRGLLLGTGGWSLSTLIPQLSFLL